MIRVKSCRRCGTTNKPERSTCWWCGAALPELDVARLALRSAAVWAVLALLAWLDRGAVAGVQHAAVFGFLIPVFSAIWGAVEAAGTAIAVSLEGVVAWLVSAFAWLSHVVITLLTSTGAIFSKVWEGMKVVWTDVLKPGLVWIDKQLQRLQAWLKDTFKPVFEFLKRVRDELQLIYKRFVLPIVDTIEFIRALNRVLLAFHIHVLQALDSVLQQLEQRLTEPILWLNAQINKIWNALELVVTADGLFQKLTLIRSMSRYVPNWVRIATAARSTPLTGDQAYAIERANETPTVAAATADLSVYYQGGAADVAPAIDEAIDRARDYYVAA